MDFFKTLINSIKHWVNDRLNALEIKIDSELEQKQPKGDYAFKTEIPEHAWESLPDKPFGETEEIEINWDGNLDSIDTKVVFHEEVVGGGGERVYACLISDKTPSDEELCRLQYTDVSYTVETSSGNWYETDRVSSDFAQIPTEQLYNYAIQNHGDITVIMEDFIYVVRADEVEYNGVIFPKAGIYVFYREDIREAQMGINYLMFVTEIKLPSSIVTLDPKYIPDDHINSLIDAKLGVIENGTY